MTSAEQANPNPECPACGEGKVFELTYHAESEPDEAHQSGWKLLEGICDVRPDRWICGACNFRWYPRKRVEQDLDLLTWQIANPDPDTPINMLQQRLAELRAMISVLAGRVGPH